MVTPAHASGSYISIIYDKVLNCSGTHIRTLCCRLCTQGWTPFTPLQRQGQRSAETPTPSIRQDEGGRRERRGS